VRQGERKEKNQQPPRESCLGGWDVFSSAKPLKGHSGLTETTLVDEAEIKEEEEPSEIKERGKDWSIPSC